MKHVTKIAEAIAVGGSVATVIVFIGVAVLRLRYPFELDWLESGMLEHARRVGNHQSLYSAPSVDFVPFPYPPVFSWIAGVMSAVFGDTFFSGRLLSLMATVGTFASLFAIVRRMTSDVTAAAIATGVYAVSYDLVGGWFDVGKPDALFLFFAVASLYMLVDRDEQRASYRRVVLAGLLMSLSILTKQTGLTIALPVVALGLVCRWRHGALFGGTIAVTVGVISLIMNAASGGWFGYWVWGQLRQHGSSGMDPLDFIAVDLRSYWPVLIVAAVAIAGRKFRLRQWNIGLVVAAGAGMLIGSYLSRMHDGGFNNVLMPACAAMALVAGLTLAALRAHPGEDEGWRVIGSGVVVLTLALAAYVPSHHLPTASNRRAGSELVAELRAIPGDVLVMSHPAYAVQAGKGAHAHFGGTIDVERAHNERAIRAIHESYGNAVRTQRFAAIVFDGDPDPWLLADLEACYEMSGQSLFSGKPLEPLEGFETYPRHVWFPKVGACNAATST